MSLNKKICFVFLYLALTVCFALGTETNTVLSQEEQGKIDETKNEQIKAQEQPSQPALPWRIFPSLNSSSPS